MKTSTENAEPGGWFRRRVSARIRGRCGMRRYLIPIALALAIALSSASFAAEGQRSLTFVQITDSHLFDSGKARPGQTPEDQKKNRVEIADSRMAWDWSMLEINRLASSGTVNFVVFTGDFGLEKVTTDPAPHSGCTALPSAVDEVARAFSNLIPSKIYLVRGTNDLNQEDPGDFARFDDFVRALAADERLKSKQIMNLTPGPGNDASDLMDGIRIVGLDSSSFKTSRNDAAKDDKDKCDYVVAGTSAPVVDRNEYQLHELQRVEKVIQADATPEILFTHIPDLDDPFKVDNQSNGSTVAAWNISEDARREWSLIIRDNRLIAVFAGHLHDANRSRYLPPYSWQAARGSRPPEVYEKTFLAPPLAAKFQLDRAPQARGLLVATVTPQGVVRAEIRWFSVSQNDILIGTLTGVVAERSSPRNEIRMEELLMIGS